MFSRHHAKLALIALPLRLMVTVFNKKKLPNWLIYYSKLKAFKIILVVNYDIIIN